MQHRKDVLILHGGVDLSTHWYHQKPISECQTPNIRRDNIEFMQVANARQKGIPIVGICRGAQLLCVAAGGSLWQHTPQHLWGHGLLTITGMEISSATAMHHQVMNLKGTEHEVLAWCPFPTEVKQEDGSWITIEKSPEIVYFPKLNALGVQAHPEWDDNEGGFITFVNEAIKTKLGIEYKIF